MPHTYLPIGVDVQINGWTLAFTLLVTVATGIVFGLVPALQASKPNLNSTLKEGGRGSGAAGAQHRLRRLLVITEIALALVLLVGAGLCIKSAEREYRADLGFDPNHVLLAGLRIGMNGYTEATGKVLYRRLEERLAALPGVQAVALSSWFPLGFEGGGMHEVTVDGYERRPGEDTNFQFSIVSPRYFAVMKIPLVAGRDFTEHDDESAPGVAIINETMAKRFWPGLDPLGRKFKDGWRYMTVIGVAKAGKYRFVNEAPKCFFYVPYRQGVWDLNLGVCLRTAGDPAGLAGAVQLEIHKLDPRVEVWATLPMSEYIKAAFMAPALASRLLGWLGAVALGLAAMGVYGVIAYAVGQRTQEFGVRMALGAATTDLLGLVLRQGLALTAIGVAAGLLLAFAATRPLASFLYGVHPFDPAIYIAVPLLLAAISLLACWLPARKASRVDPLTALRSE
jgi:predicted permease